MINPNEIQNQIIKENNLEDIADSINSNPEKNNIINDKEKMEYINDLFSIKNDENYNLSSIKLNFNLQNNNNIIKSKTNDTNQFISQNITSKNIPNIKALTNASSNSIRKIEYVNKLFDEISESSCNCPNNINKIIDNNNNEISNNKKENYRDTELKEKESINNKISSLNMNYIKENNLSSKSIVNNESNINILKSNNNLKDLEHNQNDINNTNNDSKSYNNQENKNVININNSKDNSNNNNIIFEENESISIGDIDIDALPKFYNNINDITKNSLKVKENIDKIKDNENIQKDNIQNVKTESDKEKNSYNIENNLNINEHINNLNLGNKIKLKKKKKHSKTSKIKEIINNNDLNEDNSNIPLDKSKKNVFDLFPSFSIKNNNNNKENIKNKNKKSNKLLYIKKHINENKNSNESKRYSNNNPKLFRIDSMGAGRISLEKYHFKNEKKKSETIIDNKNNINVNNLNDLEFHNSKFDNGNPDILSANNNEDKEANDIKNKIKNDNMANIYENSRINEISYFDFLNQNNLNIEKSDNDNDIFLLNNKRQKLLKNLYFHDYILKEETIFDKINKLNISEPLPILYQYMDIMKTYDDNGSDFSTLFQYINDKEKDNIYQKYNSFQNNINNKSKINTYINDFTNFRKIFEKENKNNININNFEYIRYINEINGDSFYRGFIFNYIELNLINQNIKEISMLIMDFFKIYDLEPSIFEHDNIKIKNILICFSIIYDFISVNLWEKAYIFFILVYNDELDQALISYMKYNIFLFLSKIDFILNVENKNKKKRHHKSHNNNSEEFKFEHFNYLMKNYEPKKIIFQSVCFIFGISLKIFYYDNEKIENNLYMNNSLFQNPYNEEENEKNLINLFFLFNNYHICYKKSFINSNGNDPINKSLLEVFLYKINTLSPLSKNINALSEYIFCEKCNNNCNIIEIKNDSLNSSENILICEHCLYMQIEEYLIQRNIYFHEEKFKNFLYYLQTISLEIFSKNDKNSTFNLFISNYDYILLYNKTFNERLSEIMHIICLKCSKKNNLIKLECECEMCFNCAISLVKEKTKNKIILNIYEKAKLEKKNFICPICLKKLDIDKFYIIMKRNGVNLESYCNEAIQRLKNICQKKCLNCLKKTNKIESHKIKKYIKFNVKTFIEGEIDLNNKKQKLQFYLNHCEDMHMLCYNCYKMLSKNKREIKNEGIIYKKIICNICNIEHYVDIKEWNKFKKANYCCKCLIF